MILRPVHWLMERIYLIESNTVRFCVLLGANVLPGVLCMIAPPSWIIPKMIVLLIFLYLAVGEHSFTNHRLKMAEIENRLNSK